MNRQIILITILPEFITRKGKEALELNCCIGVYETNNNHVRVREPKTQPEWLTCCATNMSKQHSYATFVI